MGKLLRAAPGRAWDREQLGYRALTEIESEDPMGGVSQLGGGYERKVKPPNSFSLS